MASREFTDAQDVVWRVWDVTPTHLHPITRAEEYMEPWAGGWLAFESATEKRRLVAPYPSRWIDYELSKLELLCKSAEPAGVKRHATPTSIALVKLEEAAERTERVVSDRTFRSPRGRLWTVRIHECLHTDESSEMVLRFTAGDSVVDLKEWPENWKELGREDYALLLLDAEPPRRTGKGDLPQRRLADRPPD